MKNTLGTRILTLLLSISLLTVAFATPSAKVQDSQSVDFQTEAGQSDSNNQVLVREALDQSVPQLLKISFETEFFFLQLAYGKLANPSTIKAEAFNCTGLLFRSVLFERIISAQAP